MLLAFRAYACVINRVGSVLMRDGGGAVSKQGGLYSGKESNGWAVECIDVLVAAKSCRR